MLDSALHSGLVLGVTHPCRVVDETLMLDILQEAAGESGVQRIHTHHSGGEVADDQVAGNAVEERPRGPPAQRSRWNAPAQALVWQFQLGHPERDPGRCGAVSLRD